MPAQSPAPSPSLTHPHPGLAVTPAAVVEATSPDSPAVDSQPPSTSNPGLLQRFAAWQDSYFEGRVRARILFLVIMFLPVVVTLWLSAQVLVSQVAQQSHLLLVIFTAVRDVVLTMATFTTFFWYVRTACTVGCVM